MLTIHNIHQYIAADDPVSKCITSKSLAVVMAKLNEIGINKDLSIDPDYQITPLILAILYHREDVSFELLKCATLDLECFDSHSNPLAIALNIYNHNSSRDKLVIIMALISKNPQFCSPLNGILQTYILDRKIKKFIEDVHLFDDCDDLASKIKRAVAILDYYKKEFNQCGDLISRMWIKRIASGVLKLDQETSLRALVITDPIMGYAISKFLYPQVKNINLHIQEESKINLYNSYMALGHHYLLITGLSLKERLSKALECFYRAREKAREHSLVLSAADQAFMHRFSCYLQLLDINDLNDIPSTFLNYSQWGALMAFETRANDLPEIASYLKAYTQQSDVSSVKIIAEYLHNKQLDLPVSDYSEHLLLALESVYGIDKPVDLEDARDRFGELSEYYNEMSASKMEFNIHLYSMITALKGIYHISADSSLEIQDKLSAISNNISLMSDTLISLPTIYGHSRLVQQPALILADLITFLNNKIPESVKIQSRLRRLLTYYIKNKLSLLNVDTLVKLSESLNLFPDKQRLPYIAIRGRIYASLSRSDVEPNKYKWTFQAVSHDNMECVDEIFLLKIPFENIVKFLDKTIKRACLKNNATVIRKLHAVISQFDNANYLTDTKPQSFIELQRFANNAIRYAKALSFLGTEAEMLVLVNEGYLPALINFTMLVSNRREFDCLFFCAWLMGTLVMNSERLKREYDLSVKDRLYIETVITDFLARDVFEAEFKSDPHKSWFLGIIEHFKMLHNKLHIDVEETFSAEALIIQSAIKSKVFPDFIDYIAPRRNLDNDYFERLELVYLEMERTYGKGILYNSNPIVVLELALMKPVRESSAHIKKSIFNTSVHSADFEAFKEEQKAEPAQLALNC